MLVHPQFNPIALDLTKIGIPVAIHWYGLTYLVAFALFLFLAVLRTRQQPYAGLRWSRRDVEDLLFWGVIGTIVGGRLGYVVFYKPAYYAQHLGEVIAVWKGGMSFHGGLIGVIIALALFARSRRRPFLEVTDLVAPCVPTGFAAVRIGNFINGELWGRVCDPTLPWAMVFPRVDSLPRHPSQLYQAALEGVLFFIILWLYSSKARPRSAVSAVFLIGYGSFRFIAEYFRTPDEGIFGLSEVISMGQWLSLPMVIIGIGMLIRANRQRV